jgi:predicted site-specific integrase-resolvase
MNDRTRHFVPTRKACKTLGVCDKTLRSWADANLIEFIRTPGDKRLYNVELFLSNRLGPQDPNPKVEKKCFVYCRVSSEGQKGDLERQIQFMQSKFPNHQLVSDIGSGLNWKRPGLRKLLQYVFRGHVKEVVVAHRDRLSRFAFELLSWIFQEHQVKLVVLDEAVSSHDAEMASDVLSILQVYACRVNGKRSYQNRKTQKQGIEDTKLKGDHTSSKD